MKSKILKLLVILGVFFNINLALAKEKSAQQVIEESSQKSVERAKENIEHVVKKAVEVVAKTQQVLLLLAHSKDKEALKLLEEVKKEMAELDKKYKGNLERLPVDVTITDITGINDIEKAKEIAKQVKEAINNNDFVTARALLDVLKNEIDIQTAYLPIALYKQSIELAYNLLKQGNKEAAVNTLQVALGTIEIETTIIPKPIAEAQILIEEAKKVYQTNKDKALKLLKQAKYDIKLAKVLGYVPSDKDIKPLIEEIENLEKAVKENSKSAESKFKHLFESIDKAVKGYTQTK